MVLRSELISSWREAGYCLVDNLFKPSEIDTISSKLEEIIFGGTKQIQGQGGFGSRGFCEFPSLCQELNEFYMNERLLIAIAELLGTDNFRLTQADAWGKTGAAIQKERKDFFSNTEQRMHMDFPNHDLAHPPLWDFPDTVAVLVYFADSNTCGGETGIVPRIGPKDELYQYPYTQMPGFGKLPWINDKELAEEYIRKHEPVIAKFRQKLYERERFVKFNKGSVLFYRHDVWHRGRPVKINRRRITCNLVFKKSNNDRINHWNPGFARFFYNIKEILEGTVDIPEVGAFEHFFAKLTPFQKSVLGFPSPGDPYWNESTIQAAEKRWEGLGMDLEPYRQLLPGKEARVKYLMDRIASLQEELEQIKKSKL